MVEYDSFELYKSNLCHRLKREGDKRFIYNTLKSDMIRCYYEDQRYAEALYLLAMVDYLSRVNNIPRCSNYDDIRRKRFAEPIFPQSVNVYAIATGSDSIKDDCLAEAIPEFLEYNIVEADIRGSC